MTNHFINGFATLFRNYIITCSTHPVRLNASSENDIGLWDESADFWDLTLEPTLTWTNLQDEDWSNYTGEFQYVNFKSCCGGNTTLTANATCSDGSPTYQWQEDNQDITGETGSTLVQDLLDHPNGNFDVDMDCGDCNTSDNYNIGGDTDGDTLANAREIYLGFGASLTSYTGEWKNICNKNASDEPTYVGGNCSLHNSLNDFPRERSMWFKVWGYGQSSQGTVNKNIRINDNNRFGAGSSIDNCYLDIYQLDFNKKDCDELAARLDFVKTVNIGTDGFTTLNFTTADSSEVIIYFIRLGNASGTGLSSSGMYDFKID